MKLKFPSIHSLWANLLKVICRFPLQVLVALTAAVSLCVLVDADPKAEEKLTVFISVCNMALTLLLAADLYAEVQGLNALKRWGLRLLMILLCTGLYFVLKPSFYLADVYRIGLLAFAFHLLVAFAPFIHKGKMNGFWQFNKSLFLRFLTSALYAAVLYAGLAIALFAIDGLFNVKIGWQIYIRLLAVVGVGFMTIFFLVAVPEDFEMLDKDKSYPKGLKAFTQYVLIPLMTIYLIILLVYEVKIIMNWVLPKGMVSTLILGYAVFGILSLLLIHPIKDKEGNGWMKLFSRLFYVMMVPLLALLLLAVWKRVGNYGITESRYILIVLAVWLSFITVYFLLSKKQNIKIIPVSLCILALLATYGPQSAFSVSEHSQVTRLKKLMASANKKDIEQRAGVVNYLTDTHGLSSLQPFTKVNLYELETKMGKKDTKPYRYSIRNNKRDTAYALLNIKIDQQNLMKNARFLLEGENVIAIKGYDYVIPVENNIDKSTLKINNVPFVVEKVLRHGNLKLKVGTAPVVEFDLRKIVKNAVTEYKTGKLREKPGDENAYYLPVESLSLSHQVDHFEIKLMVLSLNTTIDPEDEEEIDRSLSYNGYLLIRLK